MTAHITYDVLELDLASYGRWNIRKIPQGIGLQFRVVDLQTIEMIQLNATSDFSLIDLFHYSDDRLKRIGSRIWLFVDGAHAFHESYTHTFSQPPTLAQTQDGSVYFARGENRGPLVELREIGELWNTQDLPNVTTIQFIN